MKTLLLLLMIYCSVVLSLPEWDNTIEDEGKETIDVDNSHEEQNDILSPSKNVKYQNSKGNIRIVGKKICIYTDKGKRYGCVQRSKACGAKIGVFSFGCRHDEEKVGGYCFKKCSLLAGPAFPRRKSLYTCTRRGCNKNEFRSLGVCYEKCKEHYYHSVPWCFGECSHFCGSSYENYGLTCKHKSIRKKFCKRPKYTQKSFKEYEAKTRKGKTRCSGYYVDGTGECPKIDVSLYLPRGIKC